MISSLSSCLIDRIQHIYTENNAKFTKSEFPDKSLTKKIVTNFSPRRKFLHSTFNNQFENLDMRKEVSSHDLHELPYSAIVSLKIISGSYSYNGNGVFVGPSHILTSRENIIHSSLEWFDEIQVAAGLIGEEVLFGTAKVIAARTFGTTYENPYFNLALIIIDQPLGKITGWMGIYAFPEDEDISQLPVMLVGYPSFLNRMYYEYGKVTVKSEILEHTIFTEEGSSGSPILFQKDDNYFVIGIHIYGIGEINKACRLSLSKFECLLENKNFMHKMLIYVIEYSQESKNQMLVIIVINFSLRF